MARTFRTVWRLEGSDGKGPFNGRHKVDGDHYYTLSNPPGPSDDFGGLWNCLSDDERRNHRFGFLTLRQFRRWCRGRALRRALAAAGLELIRYRVPVAAVIRGAWQCAFRWAERQVVETRSPAFC